jgi:uncharacterized OB-fold protein
MKTCPSHKKMYPSQEVAEEALMEAHTRFEYGKSSGPIAVYQCDDCGHYHFTSQGNVNEKLKRYLASDKIRLQKEANKWTDKFRKR